MQFPEVMIDYETTSTDPSHGAIIQLAAVRFNLEERTVDSEMFDQCLMIPENRFWSEDTREWWLSDEERAAHLDTIWPRMRDPQTVLREFSQWAARDLDGQAPIMWAKPTLFEYPFLQSYYSQFSMPMPFPHWSAQDLNSWCRARGLPRLEKSLEFEGTEHHALHDVLHQIKALFTLMERTDVTIKDA